MAYEVIMPKQGLQMTEGTLIKWLVREGEHVEAGAPLFEMETDKLTITIDAPKSGTLLRILRGEGDTVPVAQVIALIGESGEPADRAGENGPEPTPGPASGRHPAGPHVGGRKKRRFDRPARNRSDGLVILRDVESAHGSTFA
jgi:pyruvate/2-oxoglutarate dehydrogenase complex dihydrolipoamide acyltransferase (E2) component